MKFNIINNHVLVPFIFKGKITLTSDACWGEYTSVCYKVWKTAIHCMSSFQSQNESFMPAATAAYLQSNSLFTSLHAFWDQQKHPQPLIVVCLYRFHPKFWIYRVIWNEEGLYPGGEEALQAHNPERFSYLPEIIQ